MIFIPTKLQGVWEVYPEMQCDERGAFARTSCDDEFAAHGLVANWTQCSISINTRAGTLRGMHFQKEPYGEHKLVRCTRGSIFDVAVDLRPHSSTYCIWHGLELSRDNHAALYIPPGVAHGFITLTDNSEVFYQIRGCFQPDYACGVRWNDPTLDIIWPREICCISERDANYPLL